MEWKNYLDALIHWASNRGYHVELDKDSDSNICHITKIIEIDASKPIEQQVIHLLHECGHALIFDNGSVFNFKDKKNYTDKNHTVSDKVYTVIEEAEAWRRGKELAKRLLIPINEDLWEKSMIKALKKYINWASDFKEEMQKDVDKSKVARKKRGNSKKSTP